VRKNTSPADETHIVLGWENGHRSSDIVECCVQERPIQTNWVARKGRHADRAVHCDTEKQKCLWHLQVDCISSERGIALNSDFLLPGAAA